MSAVNRVNASNFISAGKSAVNNSITALRAARENAPKYDDLANAGRTARAQEKAAAFRAESTVAMAGIRAEAAVRKAKIEADKDKSLAKSKKTVAKAGKIAAAGQLIGGNISEGKALERRKEFYGNYFDRIGELEQKRYDYLVSKRDSAQSDIDLANTNLENLSEEFKVKPSSPSEEQSTGQTFQSISVKPEAYTGNLRNLSDSDKKEIAYIVSGEAQRGTDDIYGVAGVVLNRMKSDLYPSSAYDVGRQQGQFEAVEKGTARYEPELVTKLFSETGLKKLDSALKTLDGRDSFKGQALLKNRVVDEDPMFSSGGNFYHHSYQN